MTRLIKQLVSIIEDNTDYGFEKLTRDIKRYIIMIEKDSLELLEIQSDDWTKQLVVKRPKSLILKGIVTAFVSKELGEKILNDTQVTNKNGLEPRWIGARDGSGKLTVVKRNGETGDGK